ncbi:hypothetical protein LNQ52_10270 [Klebsiella pneumoniae subsp. pneumoniae]|nr:hypothetical protein [Klebsiella pneumoniae subsp. pneumoniae]
MAVSLRGLSAVLLKTSKVKEEDDIEAATRRMHDMKAESKGASPLAAGNVTQRPGAMCVKSSSPATPGWVPAPWAPGYCARKCRMPG